MTPAKQTINLAAMSSLLLKQRWKVATADNDIVAGLARETGIPEGLATFLRRSPLFGLDLETEREASPHRDAGLEP